MVTVGDGIVNVGIVGLNYVKRKSGANRTSK